MRFERPVRLRSRLPVPSRPADRGDRRARPRPPPACSCGGCSTAANAHELTAAPLRLAHLPTPLEPMDRLAEAIAPPVAGLDSS